jgi:hypothetical protein
MAGGPAIDRAGAVSRVLRDVRGHAEQAGRRDKVPGVVPLVRPERDAPGVLPGASGRAPARRRPAAGGRTPPRAVAILSAPFGVA